MSIQSLASDLAARIPEMAHDNPINNANVIQGMLETEFASHHRQLIQDRKNLMETYRYDTKELRDALRYVAYQRLTLGNTVFETLSDYQQQKVNRLLEEVK
jgi:hypothetical protein